MEKNEIKSFTVVIPLLVYIHAKYIKTNNIKLGDMSIDLFSESLIDVQTSKRILGFIKCQNYYDKVLLNDKDGFTIKNSEEVNIKDKVVLKEQIRDLKYIEQTELFKEDEQGKD